MQGAGRLDALQDGDDAVRLDAEAVEAGNERFEVGPVEHRDAAIGPRGIDGGERLDGSLAFREGFGLTTRGASVMRTVSVPWLMATREILTSLPMTMVPVRSSMTTRAGMSDSTTRFSISA